MKLKNGYSTNVFVLFFTIILWGCTFGFAAVEKQPAKGNSAESASFLQQPDSGKPTSAFWRSNIWESLPIECLQNSRQGTVLEAYQQNEWKPFFINSRFEPTEDARLLMQRLGRVQEDDINPRPYQLETIQNQLQRLDSLRLSLKTADPNYHDSLVDFSGSPSRTETPSSPSPPSSPRYAMNTSADTVSDSTPGRNNEDKYREAFKAASELDIRLAQNLVRFAQEMDPFSRDDQIKALTGEIPMATFLKSLEPTSPHYKPLLSALQKYRKLAQTPQVSTSAPLRPGDSGAQVRNLQKRLQQEDFYKGKISGVFDSETQEALKQFQRYHSLTADGTVGQGTKDLLNIPFSEKAEMVSEAVRLLRQSPARRYDRYVRINIPQYILEYYKDGKVREVHRVIVGKSSGKKVKLQGRWVGENQTPTLASQIERVIINPRWYVTERIRKELAESISDPGYFARNGYVQLPSTYPSGHPRIYQRPGPKNPLGQVKFEFPNAYAVFLHDTPKKQLFQNSRRDFSHGCVRVEKAQELAATLLADDQNPAADRIDSYLASDKPAHIKLSESVPIIIEYQPVSTNGKGQLIFYGDPYGLMKENTDIKTAKAS
ncbi:L,D-transpeptidase family protein [Desulforhabdus amnigena]|jgi:murein L,D-transpeptidase YcbB/YkuD|uniref:L,D-TPase catalytic domain-containing protein n=1 Tax=Desulforhabdus amnigena TaxID=40218 RepID=A0A9W6FUW2_9BACT|nr:L,D-transpeptidase family protein [Desulforhabdus amnigena]NLJ29697.1 L,D-transpeptidase family protein [Deltaproteobacteria bacterium]GLI35350.1 hypothetical protein DAMNIGENAA_27830 [Desulforhabdus amnigena]